MRDKSYRATPIGGEVGRFLRRMRWAERTEQTIDTYELALSRLALDYAHYQTLEQLTLDDIVDFLDEHWLDTSPSTRRKNLDVVRSFLQWAVKERGLPTNPAIRITPPKKTMAERHAYTPVLVEQLRRAQPSLRDQICVQMLGLLALRRNELRTLRIKDFDLGRGNFLVHGKGGTVNVMPLAFRELKADLELHLIDRGPDEYLLYPRSDPSRPMCGSSVHRWFRRCLQRAGLPDTIKLHEMRHSAADNLWRQTGNLILAQQLLRHQSSKTTEAYLHPSRDDLSDALAALPSLRRD